MVAVLRFIGVLMLGLGLIAVLGMLVGTGGVTVFAEAAAISAIGFGGLLVAAASALERLDKIASALAAREPAASVGASAAAATQAAVPEAGRGETYRGVSIRARKNGIFDLVQLGKEATSLAEARRMVDRHLV